MKIFETDDDTDFDQSEKVRLFETQKRRDTSGKNYAKLLIPIALLVLAAIAAAVWLTRPNIGDEVKPPGTLRQQVYSYMLDKEKRTATEMTFYKCDGFLWVKAVAEPRSYPPSNLLDDVNQFRLSARQNGEDIWQIETLALPAKPDDVPCGKNNG